MYIHLTKKTLPYHSKRQEFYHEISGVFFIFYGEKLWVEGLPANLRDLTQKNVCAGQQLSFWPAVQRRRRRRRQHHQHHQPPPFPNVSGLLAAILLLNPLIRSSREKRLAGGRWPCPVAGSYVSAGTRPVDTRGPAWWRRNGAWGAGGEGLRLARYETAKFKSGSKKKKKSSRSTLM